MIRIGETVPGGEPPGTSFFVLLPGPSDRRRRTDTSSAHSEITATNGEVNGDRTRNAISRTECYLSGFSVVPGKLNIQTTRFPRALSTRKSKQTTMTDDPRYSAPQQPGQRVPNQQAAPGYPQAGYQQPYDWRYAHAAGSRIPPVRPA